MRSIRALSLFLAGLTVFGCGPPELAVRPVSYDVDVRLATQTHTLEAETTIELARLDSEPSDGKRMVELLLHPELDVHSIEVRGATLHAHKQRKGRSEDGSVTEPTQHRLIVESPSERMQVTLEYRGSLHQDVAAGEEEGEIHNQTVSAHVAEEGVYLAPDGYWYPQLEFDDDADPELALADYRLAVQPIEGLELVAGVERDEDRDDGALRWSSPFPLEGLVLLGGPLERSSRVHGDVRLHAVLAPGKAEVAQDILAASAEYLDRYERMIGPYPFKEFTVLEAFFSSGFAFPTCTQIAGSQLSRYKQYRRHGYLDHELLHNWFGNGVYVDSRDGNWCEGLASYLGNYYGYVLDNDDKGARKQRRNQSNFLSAIKSEDDKPLGTFGLDDGAGRGIGYQKSASVFQMLEDKIGRDAMFAGLRRFTAEQMGKFAAWDDLQVAFEEEAGMELDGFFEQWVRSGGAPVLELKSADRSDREQLAVTISQGPTDFELDVPLRLHYSDRSEDVVVTMKDPEETVRVPARSEEVKAVELDPDYRLFRRLKPDEIMPTSSVTRRADELLIVTAGDEPADGYQILIDAHRRDDEDSEEEHEVTLLQANAVDAEALAETSVVIVGDAVRQPVVQELLARTRCPVSWTENGFIIEGQEYFGPREAVYLTVHHPDVADGGVTVYYGNSPAALSNARVLGYYTNSLLVFDTPEGSAEIDSGESMPRAEVIRRMDFEFHERIDF